jgi:hypothetical protein
MKYALLGIIVAVGAWVLGVIFGQAVGPMVRSGH